MKNFKRILSSILCAVLFAGLFGSMEARAAEASKPKKATIKVKLINDGKGIKLTIGKNPDAVNYKIMVSYSGNPECKELYKQFDFQGRDVNGYGPYYTKWIPDGYSYIRKKDCYLFKLKESGEAKRTVTLESLPPGDYTFRVCGVNAEKKKGKYSKKKTVTVQGSEPGTGYLVSYDFSEAQKGDIVEFGSYEQDRNYFNGKEPIEWVVADRSGDELLLLCKYSLDSLYNGEDISTWLNTSFFEYAFNESEKSMMKYTLNTYADMSNEDEYYLVPAGYVQRDRVFLLSGEEAIEYGYAFNKGEQSDEKINGRCALAYDKRSGNWNTAEGYYATAWLLREKILEYDNNGNIIYCFGLGGVNLGGEVIEGITGFTNYGIRPAIRICTKSLEPGKVYSEYKELDENLEIGDKVEFGNYSQNSYGERTPIEWIVYDVNREDGTAILLSSYGLDCRPYDSTGNDVMWADSTLRAWLNAESREEGFFGHAFDEKERERIVSQPLYNAGGQFFGDVEGADVEDKVFIMSIEDFIDEDENGELFIVPEYESMITCPMTYYAMKQGGWTHYIVDDHAGLEQDSENPNGYWWLMNKGDEGAALAMGRSGMIFSEYGVMETEWEILVRPMITVKLNS